MARINFDDDVERQDEFWSLLALVNSDRDSALGKLVRFFRLAQKKYGHDEDMTEADLRKVGLELMIASGWAIEVPGRPGCFQALGGAKRFEWYRQKVQAGTKRATGERDETGQFISSGSPADDQRTTSEPPAAESGQPAAHQPPALAPVPAPVPVQKQENIYFHAGALGTVNDEHLEIAVEQFNKTLEHFKAGREVLQPEREQVWKMLASGIPLVELVHAISGMRYEAKTKEYDPGKHIDVFRLWNVQKRMKLVSLSTQEAERRAAKAGAR